MGSSEGALLNAGCRESFSSCRSEKALCIAPEEGDLDLVVRIRAFLKSSDAGDALVHSAWLSNKYLDCVHY